MTDPPRCSRRSFLRTGAAGALALTAGCTGNGGGGDTPSPTPAFEGRVVEVGPGGDFVFRPGTDEPLRVAAGTAVKWIWKSDGHNIVVGSQPEGTNWQGTPGGKGEVYDTGYTYTHTFETTGTYHYWCQPHKSVGMVADLVVG